jgi:cobalt-zinc-cadmium efflux system protein
VGHHRENTATPRHDHGHRHAAGASRLALAGAFAITAAFLIVEVVGGVISGSLSLLADAGHMLGDVGALGMSLWASHLAAKPPDQSKSFGYRRAEVLAAFINALALFVIVAMILREIPERFASEHQVLEGPMMIVALAGLVANLSSGAILARASRHSINVKGALMHVLADSLGSIAVLAAGAIIWKTGWVIADPIASLVIAMLITIGAFRLLRETWQILMEGTPAGMEAGVIEASLLDLEGVVDVHSLHVWSLTSGSHALSAHVVTSEDVDSQAVLRSARDVLPSGYSIDHVTLQVERCSDATPPRCPVGCQQERRSHEEDDQSDA